jgi:ADP-heptose:LPS heptosyltransferase
MEKKKYLLFWGGGLGDMFNNMYESGQYAALDHIPADRKVLILLACHNPSAEEIFANHPKRDQLIVKNIGFHKSEDLQKILTSYNAFDLPACPKVNGPINWYLTPEDIDEIDKVRDKKYVVFSTTGSDPNKNIPIDIRNKLVDYFIELDYYVVPVGKNYISVDKHGMLRSEQEWPKHEKIIRLIDKLTVPATATILKNSVGTVTCHSAINILAWRLQKPNILIYDPDSETRDDFQGVGNQWSFGKDFENTYHSVFEDINWNKIKKHVENHFET